MNSRFERFTIGTVAVFLMIVVVMISISSSANAGSFGFKTGANLATVTGEGIDSDTVIRAVVGFVGSFNISKNFAIQPELIFASKGGKGSLPDDITLITGADGTLALGYIEIPILVRYNPPVQGKAKPGFYTGPAFGLQSSATAKGTADVPLPGGGSTSVGYELDVKDFFQAKDFSWVIGGALGFRWGAQSSKATYATLMA